MDYEALSLLAQRSSGRTKFLAELSPAYRLSGKLDASYSESVARLVQECPNWDMFTIYEAFLNGIVVMCNNLPYKVASIKRIGLKMLDKTIKELDVVRHVQI